MPPNGLELSRAAEGGVGWSEMLARLYTIVESFRWPPHRDHTPKFISCKNLPSLGKEL